MLVPCQSCGSRKAVHNCKARRGVIERGQEEGREVLTTTGGVAMAPPATKEPR